MAISGMASGAVAGGFLCGTSIIPSRWPCSLVALVGNLYKSVDGSFVPREISLFLYMTSQCFFVKNTLHPALHRTRMPINNGIDKLGKMWPVNTMRRLGIFMLHRCADLTWLPSGKLIVSCLVAGRRLLTGVPSIMKMEVALVSATACDVAIVIALRYCSVGAPKKCPAVAASVGHDPCWNPKGWVHT